MHPVLHSSCSTPVPYVSGLTALEIDTSVRAGFPSPAEDFQAERIDVLKHIILHPQATYTLRVRGDSMRDEGRSVDVPWSLMEDMWVYLLHQRELRRQRSELSPSALVLTGLGNEFSKGGVVDAMKAIEKKVGYPVRAHMLRHTYPNRPAGQQPPPFKCGQSPGRVEPGGWVFSPGPRRQEIEVTVYDERRPGIVIDVGIFDARTGSLLRVTGAR